MSKQTTGEFLATLRKAHGYTQSEVAEKLNISDRTLSSWETDRTLPDLLLLPTIADIYGVTVDEILRGERAAETENNKISEQALLSSRKNHFGKFLAQSTLIYGISIIGTFVLLLTSVILPYTASPLWLNILMGVLGGICIAICMVLMFYFEYKLRVKEGIILLDDLTPENNTLLLGAKRKIVNLTLIIALILFIVVFVLLMEFIFLWLYILPFILLIVYSVACIALLLFALIYRKTNILAYGTEEQIGVLKANKKFAAKVFGFGTIPAVMLLILCTVSCLFLQVKETTYYENTDFEEFRTYAQTLVMEAHQSYAPEGYEWYEWGEYALVFPENAEANIYYRLNEDYEIYGIKNTSYGSWLICIKYYDKYCPIVNASNLELNGNSFISVRFPTTGYNKNDTNRNLYYKLQISEKFWGEQEIYESIKFENGKYGVYKWVNYDYTKFALIITGVSVCVAYLIMLLIYLIKQQKIQYIY